MTPKRIAVKLFASPDPEAPVELAPFIPLFHRLIQRASVEGLLLDVADYAHVPNGPGVVLIGHDVDYAIDSTGGRTGLLTLRKRAGDEPLADLLRDTLRKALVAAKAIEEDGSGKIRFALDTLEIQVVDRIAAGGAGVAKAEAKEGFERLRSEVAPVLAELYGDARVEVSHGGGDPRQPLGLSVVASEVQSVEALLTRLPAGAAAATAVQGPAVPGQSEWDISVEQLAKLRDDGADFTLVDVREQREFEICEIGGRLIPLGSLPERMQELDKSAYIVVHCHLGGRATHAVNALRAAGFENAWNVQGGIRAWIQRIDSSLTDYSE
jgi:rhodanese-related sulfurtransferase